MNLQYVHIFAHPHPQKPHKFKHLTESIPRTGVNGVVMDIFFDDPSISKNTSKEIVAYVSSRVFHTMFTTRLGYKNPLTGWLKNKTDEYIMGYFLFLYLRKTEINPPLDWGMTDLDRDVRGMGDIYLEYGDDRPRRYIDLTTNPKKQYKYHTQVPICIIPTELKEYLRSLFSKKNVEYSRDEIRSCIQMFLDNDPNILLQWIEPRH